MRHVVPTAILLIMMTSGCATERAGRNQAGTASEPSAPGTTVAAPVTDRDGTSMERAIVIDAATEAEGIASEAEWVREHHPGWRKSTQSLIGVNGRYYDKIEYVTPDGSTETLYFDITAFFGKF